VEISLRELVDHIVDLTGSSSRIEHKPLPEDDPVRRCPDLEKAGSLLGYIPKVQLRDGLSRTIDYFEEILREAAV
jgi:UDP-glucuronate decarboxylase